MQLGLSSNSSPEGMTTWVLKRIRELRAADRATKSFLTLLVSWIVGIASVALLRYYTFRTNAFDLGIFNQAFSTTLQGRLFYETVDLTVIPSGSFLGVHFNLLMFLLLPLYALVPRPETLLVIQTVFLGLSVVPVWLMSNHVLVNRRASLLLSAVYLFNPAILSLALYDFHLEAFMVLFLGMTFYSFLVKRWRSYFLFLVLSWITFEFAAVLTVALSMSHLLRKMRYESRREGHGYLVRLWFDLEQRELRVLLLTILGSPVVFFALLSASAYFSGTSANAISIMAGFTQFGSYSDTMIFLRVGFWLVLFGVLLFLPLLAPRNLIMVLPWFLLTLLPVPITWFSIGYQYGGAFAAPYMIWGTVFALRKVNPRLVTKRLLPMAAVLSLFFCPINPIMHGTLPGISYEQGLPIPTSHDAVLQRAIQLIPADASVLAQNNLFTRVSNRANAYVFLPNNQTEVEFVLADTSSIWYSAKIWGNQSMSRWLPYFLSTGQYGVLVYHDGVVLLKKGYGGPRIMSSEPEYHYDHPTLALDSRSPLGTNPDSEIAFLHDTDSEIGNTFWYSPCIRSLSEILDVTSWMSEGVAATGETALDTSFPFKESMGGSS